MYKRERENLGHVRPDSHESLSQKFWSGAKIGPGGPKLAAKIGPPLPKMVRMHVLCLRVL